MNAAKKKGIDAQPCFDTNSKGIDGHREEASKKAEECKETAEKTIQESLGFLDNIKSVKYYYNYYIMLDCLRSADN